MGRLLNSLLGAGTALALATPAFAQEAPYQRYELIWTGWMAAVFIVFATVGISFFIATIKWGVLRDLEEPKYYMLTIDEPDYYSPDWAKEDADAAERDTAEHQPGNQ